MATIKAYTTIEQSRKLAEILPLESADMRYQAHYDNKNNLKYIPRFISTIIPSRVDIPCWSLAALLGVLPMIKKGKDIANPFIAKTPDNEYYVVYATLKEEVDSSAMYDNPIDTCVAMIEKLNELNLL